MQAITREFDDLMTELRDGQPFAGESGENRAPFVELRPALGRLAVDDRIYGTVEELLGTDFLWASSEGNITVGDHLWHPDRPGDEEEISYHTPQDDDLPGRNDQRCRGYPANPRLASRAAARGDRERAAPPAWGQRWRRSACPATRCRAWLSSRGLATCCSSTRVSGMECSTDGSGRRYIALKYAARPQTDKQIGSLDHYSRGTIFRPLDSFVQSDDPRIRRMVDPLPALGRKQIPAFVPFR